MAPKSREQHGLVSSRVSVRIPAIAESLSPFRRRDVRRDHDVKLAHRRLPELDPAADLILATLILLNQIKEDSPGRSEHAVFDLEGRDLVGSCSACCCCC